MDVAYFLARQYPYPPCWHLVADVYAGTVPEYRAANDGPGAIAGEFRRALHAGGHGFTQGPAPVEGCIVLMAHRARAMPHHAGVYTAGRVLHALAGGTLHQDLASLADVYGKIEFWARP